MFERFTESARLVVVRAQEEARDLGHNYIGTEHLLLGLLGEPETGAAQALNATGMSIDTARDSVIEIVGRFEEPSTGQIPFTPRSKKVLELGMRECLALGHWQVGTEHLLLALLRVTEGVASQIVTQSRIDVGELRETVLKLIPPRSRDAATPVPGASRATPAPAHLAAVPRGEDTVSFTVTPDPHTHNLLMQAGGRALSDGRSQYALRDLVAVLLSDHASIAQIIAAINDREGGGDSPLG